MDIRFVDIRRQYLELRDDLLNAVERILEQGDLILGTETSLFEKEFAQYNGNRFALGVSSGTAALELSILALGVGSGDEVITVPNTFISTAFSISSSGATVKFLDVNSDTQLMDLSKVEKVISSKTKIILPVHLFGQMVDMSHLTTIAKKHNIKIIEDACQAHGSTHKGKRAGTYGDTGCFSFYPGKNLGAAGDAGAVVTNNEHIYNKLFLLRNYGSPEKYIHDIKGKNARLDSLQASVLRVKLKYLDIWNKKKNEIAQIYMRQLDKTGDLILPESPKDNFSNFHLFVIRTKNRDSLFKFLNENRIQCIIHYPVPIHLQKAYRELNCHPGDFPITEQLAAEILSLPNHPHMTPDEVDFVVTKIKEFYQ